MTEPERMYTYTQSQQIRMQTGNIGYLRADMDTNGEGFFSNWNGFRDDLKTDEFKNELNAVINALRFDSRFGDILKNRKALANYCYSNLSAGDKEMRNFFFRADTEKHSCTVTATEKTGWIIILRARNGAYDLSILTTMRCSAFPMEDGSRCHFQMEHLKNRPAGI